MLIFVTLCVDQIEEKINIDTLETLKHAFASADVNRSGDLELDEFKHLLKKQLHLAPNKVCGIGLSEGLSE